MSGALWQVAAQGRFIAQLGRTCFPLGRAVAMATDLRARGYVDAHAQLWVPEAPLPPFALTLAVTCQCHGTGHWCGYHGAEPCDCGGTDCPCSRGPAVSRRQAADILAEARLGDVAAE